MPNGISFMVYGYGQPLFALRSWLAGICTNIVMASSGPYCRQKPNLLFPSLQTATPVFGMLPFGMIPASLPEFSTCGRSGNVQTSSLYLESSVQVCTHQHLARRSSRHLNVGSPSRMPGQGSVNFLWLWPLHSNVPSFPLCHASFRSPFPLQPRGCLGINWFVLSGCSYC
ncbi:hypothetical protein BD289DRAFT_146569 [Coniella lustricola]|uniref:Uncharacterized protein n=1 Tax=Coniella lustricola TaxID=2025994 RepID=A0A2T2ZV35_9PEZI|nr:hypothetical protein BD289DRAFT_146569 [Coniella lustricola]